ncbi:hypothetical protein JVT61DRAFT_9400 [Boletus reticuloceps]|uniref:HNH nuclease domain-containing protein n=1 Tax=Boletus reticuloceps TaxID=495285 RepID=A0A8I2YGR5_9AGAM|nr:hypothetical protein JVT61DRAFT_9400 [Boletus reticuloceps]
MAPKRRSQGTHTHPALYNSPSVSENTEEDQSIESYISSQLRDLACTADPNGGRCLITRRGTPIDASHLVAQVTEDDILAKLEYVWMVGYEQLNEDIRYNILFLRVDWHQLFDHKQWMLVPQIHILRELKRIYLVEGHKSFNLEEVMIQGILFAHII